MLNSILDFINQYGMIAIFIAILIEYACFPIPSEVILPLAGAIAIENNSSYFYVLFISVIAGNIGSIICYLIGYCFGRKGIDFLIKIYPKSERGIYEAELKYNKYSNLSVSVGRLIPLCRTYISFIAGVSKQNFIKYLFFSSLGITVWNSILILLGFKFYQNLDYVIEIYNNYKLVIIFLLIILVIGLLFIHIFKKAVKKDV